MSVAMRPGSPEQATALVNDCLERGEQLAIRGAGTRAGFSRSRICLTSGLVEWRFFEPDDMVLGVDAGLPFASLLRRVREAGMSLPVEAWFEGASVGGVVAANDWGPSRMSGGGVRDFIIGMEYVNGMGQLVKTGGRVVKNVTGYDLSKMMTGSLGGLGLITAVHFKMNPAPIDRHVAYFRMRGRHWLEWLCVDIYKRGLPLDWVQAVFKQGLWYLAMGFSGNSARLARIKTDLQLAFDNQLSFLPGPETHQQMPWFAESHRQSGFLTPHLRGLGDDFCHLHALAPVAAFFSRDRLLATLSQWEDATLVFHPLAGDLHFLAPAGGLCEERIDLIRRAFAGSGGYLVLERVPLQFHELFGSTIPLPSEYALQQRLKKQLDPKNVFHAPFYHMV